MEKTSKLINSRLPNTDMLIDNSINNAHVIRICHQSNLVKLAIVACLISALCSCASNSAQAELRSYGSNANQYPSIYRAGSSSNGHTYTGNNSYSRSYGNGFQKNDDKIRTLIHIKSNDNDYEKTEKAFYKNQANEYHNGHSHSIDEWNLPRGFSSANLHSSDYYGWIDNYYNKQRVSQYEQFISRYLGENNIPPMSQLLLTARTWRKCGASAYEVPPDYLWDNMIPTLQLYTNLKNQSIIPRHTVIRSVYRNPSLNKCAGGANGSKHKMNAAMDLWLPEFEYDISYREKIREQLCQFWLYNGESYNMGLGIYKTGSIHIDTQGYRKWGVQNTASYSSCRH